MTTESEVSLAGILAALRRRQRVVVVLTAVVTLLGVLYAFLATPLYTATIATMPANNQEGGALSSLASRLGPAAALAGINLGGGGSNKETYLAILRSQDLAGRFIARYELLPDLFPERWDAKAKQWRRGDSGPIGWATGKISWLLAKLSGDRGWKDRAAVPSTWEAYEQFARLITIEQSPTTGVVTVAFEFADPERAALWANKFVALANQQLRERAVHESTEALEYLNARLEATSMLELRQTMYHLVETHLEQITLANVREEFAFTIIDAAVVPEQRSHPQRILTVVLSLVIGLILGVAAALTWDSARGAWRDHAG
jgi:uncharacterized protein involved in exopolysaccharide biosynthesis